MAITDEIDELHGDALTDLGVTVIVRRVTPGAFTASTGVRAATTADTSVRAIRLRSSTTPADASGRRVERTRWRLPLSEVTTAPDHNDRLLVGTAEHVVKAVQTSCGGRCFDVDCERVVA